jgi:ribonuclease VapC
MTTDLHVDASAIVGILLFEPDRELLLERLALSGVRQTSIVSAFEAVISIGKATGNRDTAYDLVSDFLGTSRIVVAGADDMLLGDLAAAHVQYGKGSHHPARLNMGDCFSYAMAKKAGVPLLYKGHDFALTDLG